MSETCPLCSHGHLDYDDETCVSCGCAGPTSASWRHAARCETERGGNADACTCGLGAQRVRDS